MRASALLVVALCAVAAVASSEKKEASWTVISNNLMDIAIGVAVLDDASIYVSGGANGVGPLILRSRDVGATWEQLGHGAAMFYLDIDVTEARTGVTGGLGMFRAITGLEYTTDGEVFVPVNETFMASAFQNVEAPRNSSHFAVGFWQSTATSPSGDGVIASFDNGASVEYCNTNSGSYSRYGAFPSDDVWYISGGEFPVSTLTDAANKWESRFDREGFALNQRLRVTMKGGKQHYSLVEPAKTDKKSGYYAVISKTVDGGLTFENVFSDEGYYFNGISCASVDHCIAVAEGEEGAYIYTTLDGGASWNQTLFAAGRGLFQVQFRPDTLEAWAVGADFNNRVFYAVFYHTLDGGITWDSDSNIIEGVYPNSIDVLADGTAYATAFLASGLSGVVAYL